VIGRLASVVILMAIAPVSIGGISWGVHSNPFSSKNIV